NRQYCSNIRSEESLTFNLHAPMLPANLAIAVTGDFLNEKWSIKEALELKFKHYPIWEISVPLKNIPKNIEYKYILIDRESKGFISWEGGNNRNFITPPYKPREEINITDDVLICEFPDWRAAGVVIPLFSLRSNRSWGVGEISDLKLMAEWANNAGLRFVQLLPINDTTNMHSWHDSYPYSANSSFALNPLYLDVIKVGKLKTEDKMRKYLCEAQALNALLCIDYDKVITLKERYLRELYEESGYTDLKSDEFNLFAEDNKEWLIPYAAYSHLRDIYGTSNFENWGEYAIYNTVEISRLTAEDSPSYNEIGYYYFLQYHLHKQMIAVREYAHSIGVMFKGDIPIGVNRYSADVWQNPNLFDCNMQAGAPPDDFATDGQNWGFPTYRWDIMQKTRYEWWCARLQNMSQYFDAYRIDHVLGFFRIWSIPADTISGLLGYFVPALPLSSHEIKSAGFNFNPDKHTKPYITDSIINNTFDKYA
ncbi:MAG: 4-alpha-glucanotransferase, partial [Bacteroidales bacterium]